MLVHTESSYWTTLTSIFYRECFDVIHVVVYKTSARDLNTFKCHRIEVYT